jgi:hypothetical protein
MARRDVFRQFLTNLDQPMPLSEKVRKLSGNLWRRVVLCQGRCNHEPILNWPPWLNELQRTTTMSAGEQTPTKLRQNQVIPTPTHKRRLPNASRLAASGAQSHFR